MMCAILFSLSQQLMEVNEQAVEPWVCMGYYSLNSINKQNERLVRTVYCAQKVRVLMKSLLTTN